VFIAVPNNALKAGVSLIATTCNAWVSISD
jgi:hypothetical protein